MLKHLSFIVITFYGGQKLVAQDSTSTLDSKSIRIGFLDPSRAVGKGNFMLEGGLSFYHSKYSNSYQTYQTNVMNTPKLKLRYGVSKSFEVFVEQNNFMSNKGYSDNDHTNFLGAGFKLNMTQQKGLIPNSSISVTQQYISSAWIRNGFRTKATYAWDYDLGKRFNLAGNFIYAYSYTGYHDIGLGLKLTYKVNPKLNLYMDWYGGDSGYDFSVFNIGASYQVSPRLNVFANAGTNHWLTSYPGEKGGSFNVSMGVAFLLNNPQKKKRSRKRK